MDPSHHQTQNRPDSPSLQKVKVYYSFRGTSTTRMAVFSLSMDNAAAKPNTGLVPIPLRDCLWAMCTSSPDIICQEHDLSIYTANFQESCSTLSDKGNSTTVWEGQGLLSWIMNDNNNTPGDAVVHGKYTAGAIKDHIEVHIELQPTLKWAKNEFYSALRTKNFYCFKNPPRSPPHHLSSCSCGINAASHASVWSSSRDSSSTTISDASSPFRNQLQSPSDSSTTTEFDRYLSKQHKQLTPPPPQLPQPIQLPPTTHLFRPEPIFPPTDIAGYNKQHRLSPPIQPTYHTSEKDDLMARRRRVTDGDTLTSDRSGGFNNNNNNNNNNPPYYGSRLPPPLPSSPFVREDRRSAFTRTVKDELLEPSPPPALYNSHNHHHLTTATAVTPPLPHTASLPLSSAIPVIYTPSNKKRKKITDDGNARKSTASGNKTSMTQQISTAIRTYYDVDRDVNGNYALPVEIDSWTVVDLGIVVYDRPAYHNQRYIYPVNYTVRKWYRSMVDAKSDTQYTCRILDNGSEPKFEVTADDCPVTYSGPTPTTVWTIIVRRAFAIRNQEYGHNPVGPDFFGLRKNTIAKMIQDLPNAEKCSQYVWQTFEPARFNKPGRNRRRTDPMALLGGVNYSLTSTRSLFPHAHHAVGDYPRDPQPPPEPLPHSGVSMRLNLHEDEKNKAAAANNNTRRLLPSPSSLMAPYAAPPLSPATIKTA